MNKYSPLEWSGQLFLDEYLLHGLLFMKFIILHNYMDSTVILVSLEEIDLIFSSISEQRAVRGLFEGEQRTLELIFSSISEQRAVRGLFEGSRSTIELKLPPHCPPYSLGSLIDSLYF